MAAYMIVFCRIKDRARFLEDYAKPTAALLPQFGGEYLVRTPKVAALEGAFGDGLACVVSKWPTRAHLDAFYGSPAYAPLKAARAALSDCSILIAEDPA
ncbi:MAG: DUF1330 domain-containing protein [Parvularculaceae bacterium]|nr:DUF1330 domain-containing protein [Parvularculaceae bacterium]